MMSFPIRCIRWSAPLPVFAVERPVVGEPEGGDVVGEGVEPDVENVVGLLGNRDAPRHPGTAHAEVLQPLPYDRQHLVLSPDGLDPDPARLDLVPKPVPVRRQPEEEVLLLGPFAGELMDRAGVPRLLQLVLVVEGLATRAVPAGVLAEVDGFTPVGRLRRAQALPESQHTSDMPFLGGADEVVVLMP